MDRVILFQTSLRVGNADAQRCRAGLSRAPILDESECAQKSVRIAYHSLTCAKILEDAEPESFGISLCFQAGTQGRTRTGTPEGGGF